MKKVVSFEKLSVFQKAYKASLKISEICARFPDFEKYTLASQMRRASMSICANIAEGFAKQPYSKADFKRYLLIALGSSDEMKVWLRYSFDFNYIDEKTWEYFKDEYDQISKMLHSMHKKV